MNISPCFAKFAGKELEDTSDQIRELFVQLAWNLQALLNALESGR